MERLTMEACASGRVSAAGQDGSLRRHWGLMLLVAAAYAVLLIAGVGIGLNAVTVRQGLGGGGVGEELPVVGRRQLLQEEQGDAVDADGCPVCEFLCLTCPQHPEPSAADSCLAAQLCADPLAVGVVDDTHAAKRSAAFRLLDATEISAVTRFMERSRGFIPSGSRWNLLPLVEQLTAASIPVKGTDDIIVRVETMHPSKAEVLEFLDERGPEPKRYAKVVVVRGSQQDVMEYRVGPVPFPPEVGPAEVLTLRGDGEIPWAKRPAFGEQEAWEEVAVAQAAWQLRALLKELTGGRCYPVKYLASLSAEQVQQSQQECEEGWLGWHSSAAHQPNPAERHAVVSWKFSPGREGGSEAMLHGVPLSFKLNASDADYMQWTTFDFEYCHQGPFASAVELLQAWEAGELRACAMPGWASEDYNYDWAVTHKPREPFPGFSSPGPRMYEAGYKRFAVLNGKAPTGNGFRWLHWEGFFLLNPERGLQLFDLRWKGDRIVYELALQEQFSAFSGYANSGMAVRMESAASLGESAQPLKLGVDCPETATYFPATRQWSPLDVGVERDVICMFEHDLGGSAWRHTQPGGLNGPHIDGVRGTALVIRTIATVGNYNYGYDVIFHLDASIEVKIWMGGYMDTVFFSPDGATEKDSPFGTRVQNHTFAMMHDHLSHWKVDLDVHGTLNSFRKDVVREGSFAKALQSTARGEGAPGWFSELRLPLKYVESSAPQREGSFVANASEPAVWRIVNEQVVNAWGAPSGYAVFTGLAAHQLLPASHPVAQAAAWSKYNLAITQRKEDEATSTSSCDAFNPGFPVTSLDQYLDGESIEEQDLVAWVTVGEHHLPRTEDLPLFKSRGTSFYIKPWDYFEELQSMHPADTSDFQPYCVPRIGDQYEYGSFYDRVVG